MKNKYLSGDAFTEIGNKIKLAFLDFIVQTKSGINEDIASLINDTSDSIVVQLAEAQQQFPDMQILKDLEEVPNPRVDGTKTIQLSVNLRNDPYNEDLYAGYELEYIEPELREGRGELILAQNNNLPKLIEATDLKGILHNHSKYSDGMNTLAQMANRCRELGYSYFGICDHSQSAFYANGMKPETVLEQQLEIDELNNKITPFKIFKGIESDILNDGSLDYKKEILETFDFVVASIHSNLKMDQEKATARLLKAIENPFTTILGHPTGRLLLSREGYPIDHKKIIEACAANGVAIELNAHPYRLDIDWTWIPYCIDKGVLISINPDAHETEGLLDLHWGTAAARKGMLTKETCLNAMNLEEITKWFESKKTKTKQ